MGHPDKFLQTDCIFIAFLYGGISILTGQTGMAYALLVVFSILITSTISFDENSHWDIYARTPVTSAQLVGSNTCLGCAGWRWAQCVRY